LGSSNKLACNIKIKFIKEGVSICEEEK